MCMFTYIICFFCKKLGQQEHSCWCDNIVMGKTNGFILCTDEISNT